jgi:hypothetical protein
MDHLQELVCLARFSSPSTLTTYRSCWLILSLRNFSGLRRSCYFFNDFSFEFFEVSIILIQHKCPNYALVPLANQLQSFLLNSLCKNVVCLDLTDKLTNRH